MPMQNGATVLGMLRARPDDAIKAWGFITRGACLNGLVGGAATLNCARHGATSVYEVNVTAGGTDYYIPFRQGQALYCDVPRGRPNGTLVVTYAMNGCALEVQRREGDILRFHHDSDGRHMPVIVGSDRTRAFRAVSGDYSGRDENALHAMVREREKAERRDFLFTGNFEHNIFCVKVGIQWEVYSSAVVIARTFTQDGDARTNDAWQIKQGVPSLVGRFAD